MRTSVVQYLSFYSFVHGGQLKCATLMPLAAIPICDAICVIPLCLLWCTCTYKFQNWLASTNDKIFNLYYLSQLNKYLSFITTTCLYGRIRKSSLPSISATYTAIPMTSTPFLGYRPHTQPYQWHLQTQTIVIDGIGAWTVNYVFLNIGVWGIPAKKYSAWAYTSSNSIKVWGHWQIHSSLGGALAILCGDRTTK